MVHYSSQVPSSSSSSGCAAPPSEPSFPEVWFPEVSFVGVSLPALSLPALWFPELSSPSLSFALHSSSLLSFSLLSFPLLSFPEPWFPELALPDSDGYDAVPVAPATPEEVESVALFMGYGGWTELGSGGFWVSAEVGPEGGAAVVESGAEVELVAEPPWPEPWPPP